MRCVHMSNEVGPRFRLQDLVVAVPTCGSERHAAVPRSCLPAAPRAAFLAGSPLSDAQGPPGAPPSAEDHWPGMPLFSLPSPLAGGHQQTPSTAQCARHVHARLCLCGEVQWPCKTAALGSRRHCDASLEAILGKPWPVLVLSYHDSPVPRPVLHLGLTFVRIVGKASDFIFSRVGI